MACGRGQGGKGGGSERALEFLRSPLSILEGITRETILALAPRAPIEADVRDLTPYDLYTADEVFLTSTVVGVMPIVELDGRVIGTGARGPVGQRLQALYDEVLVSEGMPIASGKAGP